jgi:hypothetical protein
VPTGIRPRCADALRVAGVDLSGAMFMREGA